MEIEHEAVTDYYYVEPEPEAEPEVCPVEPEVVIEAPPSPPPSPKKQEVRAPQTTASWLRLTTPTRPPRRGQCVCLSVCLFPSLYLCFSVCLSVYDSLSSIVNVDEMTLYMSCTNGNEE